MFFALQLKLATNSSGSILNQNRIYLKKISTILKALLIVNTGVQHCTSNAYLFF